MLKEIILSVAMMLEPYDLPTPPIEYASADKLKMFSRGYRTLGVAVCMPRLMQCRIYINECLESDPKVVRKVLIHELAHYVDFMNDGEMEDHKGEWRRIMHGWDQRATATYFGTTPRACGG